MSLGLLKQWHRLALTAGLLAGAMSLSACQKQAEPEPVLEENIAEQSVPMSAEPAEPNDTVVAAVDPTFNEGSDDPVAIVNTSVTQRVYACSPEMEIDATYNDDDNQVILVNNLGTLTLTKVSSSASNPEIFEAPMSMNGDTGLTQWHVSHTERATGVMRTTSASGGGVSVYECNVVP